MMFSYARKHQTPWGLILVLNTERIDNSAKFISPSFDSITVVAAFTPKMYKILNFRWMQALLLFTINRGT